MRAAVIVVLGLVLGVAAALAVFPEARQKLMPSIEPTVTGKALVGGPFALTDATGKQVTEKDYLGRYTLVFFGFTSCPDICPAGLQLISAALENLGAKADRLTPIFVSVDPERDTPPKISAYLRNFSPRFVGLTGTPQQITDVAKAYKVYYKKIPSEGGPPGDYGIDHTSIIYLMGPDGEFITHFTPTTTVDDLTAKLDKIL